MANTWTNADGLYLKTGTDEGALSNAGAFRNDGPYHVAELTLFDLTDLGTARTIFDDVTIFPKGARVERVDIVTETAVTSSGSGVLNVGLVRTDRSTTYDDDGFIAALPVASFNAVGETVSFTAGVQYGGAFLGTTLANAGLFVADYDTADFTAGKVVIRVYYRFPVTNTFN